MYYQPIIKRGAILAAAALLTLTACNRNKNNTATPDYSTADDKGGYASDAAKLERNGNDALNIADNAVTANTTGLRTTSGYPTITKSYSGSDTVITIDFGPTDHVCADLRTRKGQIIVSYSGHYKDSLSTHTIVTNGYYVDDYQVMLHKTVTNQGMNSSGQVWYTVTVNDSIVLGADSTISWTGSRTRTWLSGYGTSTLGDDVYAIGGTTVLTRANSHVFTCTISPSDPLKVALSCRWIESGTMTVSSPSFAGGDRTLDFGYGGGDCDNKVQVTIGTRTYYISMW